MKHYYCTFISLVLAALFIPLNAAEDPAPGNFLLEDSGYVNVRDGKLFYTQSGSGQTLVFLHDAYHDAGVWDEQFRYFSRYFRCLRYDRRGFGKSSATKQPYNCMDDLTNLMNETEITKACLIGLSEGAALAVDYAISNPMRVSALILINPQVGGMPLSEHYYSDILTTQKNISKSGVTKGTDADDPELKTFRCRFTCPEMRIGSDKPAINFLNMVQVPVIMITGELAPPDIHAHAGALEAGIRNAIRMVVKHGGYNLPTDQPETLNQTIYRFLKDISFLSLIQNGGAGKACAVYNSLCKTAPGVTCFSREGLMKCGRRYQSEGKLDEAIQLYHLTKKAFPDSWSVCLQLSIALDQDGKHELANKYLLQAVELSKEK